MGVVVEYYYGNERFDLEAAAGEKDVVLSKGYWLNKPGAYTEGTQVWRVDKEGLYRFYTDGQLTRQHCYYERDAFALVASLLRCCDFSGELKDVGKAMWLNGRLLTGNERNLTPALLLRGFLYDTLLAYRQVYLYSPVLARTVFELLEVWNERINSWEIYWPERSGYLGRTNAGRTCFDVFDDLACGRADIADIAPFKVILDEELSGLGILTEVNAALSATEQFPRLAKKLKLIPLLRDEGRQVLKAAGEEKYEELLRDKAGALRLDDNPGIVYQARFFGGEYIREVIYGPQLYIVYHKGIRVNGGV